jgi:hypothetical protein
MEKGALTARAVRYCTASDVAKGLADCGFTEEELRGVLQVSLTPHGGAINILTDGTDPTSDEGHYIEDHGLGVVDDANDCARVRMIRAGQVNAKVTITVYVM